MNRERENKKENNEEWEGDRVNSEKKENREKKENMKDVWKRNRRKRGEGDYFKDWRVNNEIRERGRKEGKG